MSRQVRWFAAVVVTLMFPVAALVAGIAYLVLRRRWSDRLVAVGLALLAVGACLVAAAVSDYWTAWQHVVLHLSHLARVEAGTGDWTTVVGTGLALGPALGALVWLVSQIGRER